MARSELVTRYEICVYMTVQEACILRKVLELYRRRSAVLPEVMDALVKATSVGMPHPAQTVIREDCH